MPIAAGLIHLGASPVAALAFLITGPATNAATITTVWKLLGSRTTALYLLTIAISAVAGGLALDWLMAATQATVPCVAGHAHHAMGGSWLSAFWAGLLLAVFLFSYAARPRPKLEHAHESGADGALEGDSPIFVERKSGQSPTDSIAYPQRLELAISGMTCSHCVEAVARP